jgi:hypothetical protein
MGYINDFRAKLAQLIEEGKHEEALKYAADSVWDSYKNGQKSVSGLEEKDVRKAQRFAKRSK